MSHIVIDAREYSTSTGRYVSRLLHYLDKLDQEHSYTVLLKPGDLPKAQFTNPRFTKLACPYKEFTFAEQLGLLRQINNLQPDLVHFTITNQPVLYQNKKITTIHDLTTLRFMNPDKNQLVFKLKQQVLKFVIHRAARTSARVITPTQYVCDDVKNYTHIGGAKLAVTYEAADLIADQPEPYAGLTDKKFIMYVGRPTPHKNLGRLVEAFQQLQADHPDLRLVLAGKLDANYLRLKQQTEGEQITNIIYTDFLSEGQLRWLYEHCAAYVFPSLSEGFGLPPLEAMQHGAPVISSNATCLPEVYGQAAEYFDPLDVNDMVRAISSVIDYDDRRQALIAAGHAQAARYSWQTMAQQTMEIYNQALRR